MAKSHPPQLPAFLTQKKADVHAKFIDLEWQQRNRLLQGTQATVNPSDPPSRWSQPSGPDITSRNRYMNVQPYAQNRIKLGVPSGVNDYINASPIVLGEGNRRRRYIATQGPKDTSVNHFYRMVASDDVVKEPVVVVMLTQTHESGREKCFQYYPLSTEESPLMFPPDQDDGTRGDGFEGEVVLESVEENEATRSERRRLRLRTKVGIHEAGRDEEIRTKEIHHLLFSGWPDFLIPEGEDRAALINLIALSAQLNDPNATVNAPQINGTSHSPPSFSNNPSPSTPSPNDQSNPRIIHCSAGVGRSGTFIALDYLLSLLYSGELDSVPNDCDPVAETVDLLRQQRMMMVQGEAQFNFIYEVLREQFMSRYEMSVSRAKQDIAGVVDGAGGATCGGTEEVMTS